MAKRLKIGLALGAGGARGLSHIGILKVLEKHNIRPDYIAGTSMGAVIGALYAAGYSPAQIEEIAKTTNWKKIVDFTIPKAGLLEGLRLEKKLRLLLNGKRFGQLRTHLRVVAYNITKHEKVVFSKGDVAKAVRASLSIPGIFSPVQIKKDLYMDGVVSDPTPFDVVREMGAEVVIAVDLYTKQRTVAGPEMTPGSFSSEILPLFVSDELKQIKKLILPQEWPLFILRFLTWVFDKILHPARVLKFISRQTTPPIISVMNEAVNALSNNLAKERLEHAKIDVKVTPSFGKLKWSDFDHAAEFIKLGEEAMTKEMSKLKRKIEV